MDDLAGRLSDVRGRIERACSRAGRPAASVRLIAVTKNHPAQTVQALIDLGVRDIGENRVQEIEEKAPALTGEFTVHMIGHLQTNKAGKVWPLAEWIQSVDRERLVRRLEGLYGGENGPSAGSAPDGRCRGGIRPPGKKKVLVEVNTSGEESKSGCRPEECLGLCEIVARSAALDLRGLMTIGPLGGDERAVRRAFAQLRELSRTCCTGIEAPELSMGMSGDFEWAVEEGATMVRVGTVLVGGRVY
ncbi:MAG: YggS family pyridoxal phosphate-dependent enzyme [Chitinispirillia bacterium]|nr:YggS family pyridoxal phosphate-dependent enzyme [Chitinispirillia bacterium]MCL2241368.1 YggS family pyridoxal phosphate-dependent enzyme [Chitinispirillia bacterium]